MSSVGDLVANFTANTQGFSKPVADMRKQTAAFAISVKSSIGAITGAFAPLMSIVAPIAGAFAFKHVVDEARAASGAAKKFQAVLDATGGSAGITTKEMQEFAGQLQKTTNFEDDATVAAAALLARFTNIRGDVFKDAIKSAMDLSALTGEELPASIEKIGRALQDPINGMMRLRKAGIFLTAEQQQQVKAFQQTGHMAEAQGIIIKAMQSSFGGTAAAMASPFTQIKNIIGDISENIGFALLPSLKEVVLSVQDWMSPIQGATDGFKEFGENAAVVVRNFTALFKAGAIDWEIAVIEAVPGMEGALHELAATISGLWSGASAAFDAFLSNVTGGLKEIKNVFSATTAGVSAAAYTLAAGKPLAASKLFADAFSETLANQENTREAKNPFAAFMDSFDKSRDEMLAGFNEDHGGLIEGLKKQRDDLNDAVWAGERARAKEPNGAGELHDIPGTAEKMKGHKGAEAVGVNSKEGLSNIFSAMRSAGNTVEDKLLKNSDRQLELEEDDAEVQKDIAANTAKLADIQFIAGVV